jgi:prevent-host-death family protein
MPTIPQKELRNNVSDVLRRAEAGEQFTITVSGRPVAELGPARSRQLVSGERLRRIWETPAPQGLGDDLADFGGDVTLRDPWSA